MYATLRVPEREDGEGKWQFSSWRYRISLSEVASSRIAEVARLLSFDFRDARVKRSDVLCAASSCRRATLSRTRCYGYVLSRFRERFWYRVFARSLSRKFVKCGLHMRESFPDRFYLEQSKYFSLQFHTNAILSSWSSNNINSINFINITNFSFFSVSYFLAKRVFFSRHRFFKENCNYFFLTSRNHLKL